MNRAEKIIMLLLELAGMSTADQMVKEFEKIIKKHFPKGYADVQFSTHFSPDITIRFGMEGDINKLASGIRDNDPAYHIFMLRGMDKEGQLGPKMQIDAIRGGVLMTDPDPDSRLAMKAVKIGWRKKTAAPDKILKHFDNYMVKVKKAIEQNKGKVRGLA